jgi:hypothetical protein
MLHYHPLLYTCQKGDFSDTVELSGRIFDKIGFDRLHTLSCTAFPKKVSPHTGVDDRGATDTINRGRLHILLPVSPKLLQIKVVKSSALL